MCPQAAMVPAQSLLAPLELAMSIPTLPPLVSTVLAFLATMFLQIQRAAAILDFSFVLPVPSMATTTLPHSAQLALLALI